MGLVERMAHSQCHIQQVSLLCLRIFNLRYPSAGHDLGDIMEEHE